MKTAKIIRHRHKWLHTINDDIKGCDEAVYYKIVFSDPRDYDKFIDWVKGNKGEYNYDKETNTSNGNLPELAEFGDKKTCWCEVMSFYLLEVEKYEFNSIIEPYKGEVYWKKD